MPPLRFLGCMTGTSCDGLDIAYLETNGQEILHMGASTTIPFDISHQQMLKKRLTQGKSTPEDKKISQEIAKNHEIHIRDFLKKHQLIVDVIGIHGQAVWHDPTNKITIQLGDAQALANKLHIPVVADFRTQDINLGGQGAPLVPIYHLALAKKLAKPLIFLNIGGIANITYIDEKNNLSAGDVGAGNALIDDWMLYHTNTPYDQDGKTAAQGKIQKDILEKWQSDSFFQKSFPKSLDRQYFHPYMNDIKHLTIEDGAATLTALSLYGIEKSLTLLPSQPRKIIVCGGGCYNKTIMKGLQKLCPSVVTSDDIGINPNAIEAQLMAYLAARYFYNYPSSFPSTTGVSEPTIAGKLFMPQ